MFDVLTTFDANDLQFFKFVVKSVVVCIICLVAMGFGEARWG